MYFITGGRGSQSGLYRVTYEGPQVAADPVSEEKAEQAQQARAARHLRQQLEKYQSNLQAEDEKK